jgi:hypothetical protein
MASMDYCSIIFDENGIPVKDQSNFTFEGLKIEAHKNWVKVDDVHYYGSHIEVYSDKYQLIGKIFKNKLFWRLTVEEDANISHDRRICGITGYAHIDTQKYYNDICNIPKGYNVKKQWVFERDNDEAKELWVKYKGNYTRQIYSDMLKPEDIYNVREVNSFVGITKYDIKKLISNDFLFSKWYDPERDYIKSINKQLKTLPEVQIDDYLMGNETPLFNLCFGDKDFRPTNYWKYL